MVGQERLHQGQVNHMKYSGNYNNLGNPKATDALRVDRKTNSNGQRLLKGKIEKSGSSVNRIGNIKEYYLEMFGRQIRSPTLDGLSPALEQVDFGDKLMKAALTTADTGAVNSIYTMGAFIQYATRKSTWGALPKVPWNEQGFRAVTAASSSSAVGIDEGQALGTGVEAEYVEVAPTVKEWELVHDYSSKLGVMSEIADAVTVEQDRVVHEADFFRSMNQDLVQDNDTLADFNIESTDRIAGSYSEIAGCGQTVGDLDIYSNDRDGGATWTDAYVSHNSGTDRDLTAPLINALFTNTYPYWEEQNVQNKVYITGLDTLQVWGELEAAKQRLVDNVPAQITIGDGVKTVPGAESGMMLSTYQGIPIIPDDLTASDTKSRVQLLDLDNIAIMFGIPPAYYDSDDMFQVGHLTKGVWYGAGELYAKKFKCHGKLRDLQ